MVHVINALLTLAVSLSGDPNQVELVHLVCQSVSDEVLETLFIPITQQIITP